MKKIKETHNIIYGLKKFSWPLAISCLIFITGVVGTAFSILTKNIDLGFFALGAMITIIAAFWSGLLVYYKIGNKKILNFADLPYDDNSFRKNIDKSRLAQDETYRNYNNDLIKNPAFSNLVTNIYHKHQ